MTWIELPGELFNDAFDQKVVATTNKFGDYTLASLPRWRDDFTHISGLSVLTNTTVLGDMLRLNGLSLTGTAVSRPITPTTAIEAWGMVIFSRTVPTDTNLSIDVLDIISISLADMGQS